MGGPTLSATLEAKLDAFTQQMSQAGELADKAVKQIEQTFKDSNPTFDASALTSALGGLAGGAVLGGLITALVTANSQLTEMAQNAKLAGLSLEDYQKLQYAGNLGGLSSKDFGSGVVNLATKLNEASRDENDLTKFLDANNVKWKDQYGQVIGVQQAIGSIADLVRNAGNELDKIKIVDMVGLSKDWIATLEQGSTAFNRTADSATAAGVVIEDATVNKALQFTREWNASSAQWSATMKAALAGMLPFFDDLIAKAKDFANSTGVLQSIKDTASAAPGQGQSYFGDISRVVQSIQGLQSGTGAVSDVTDALKNLFRLSLSYNGQQVFSFGDQINAQAQQGQAALARIAAAYNAFTTAAAPGGTAATRSNVEKLSTGAPAPATKFAGDDDESKALDRAVAGLNKHIATLDADTIAVGLNAGEHEKLRAELTLLNAASKDDDDITTAQIDNYTKLRATMTAQQALDAAGIDLNAKHAAAFATVTPRAGEAAQAVAQAKANFAALNTALTFAGDQAISVLDGLRTGSLTAAAALQQLTNNLINALEQAVLLGKGPLAGILGLAAPAGSGGLGGIFGAFTKTGAAAADPGFVPGAFASGTDFAPGGAAWVGERGPELVNLPRGASVTPTDALASLASTMGAPGGDMNVKISIDLTGANGNDTIMRIARAAAAQGVQQAVGIVNAAAPQRQARLAALGT